MQLSGLERPNNDRFQYLSGTPVKRPDNRLHGIVLRLDLTLECLGRNNLVSRHLNGLCIVRTRMTGVRSRHSTSGHLAPKIVCILPEIPATRS